MGTTRAARTLVGVLALTCGLSAATSAAASVADPVTEGQRTLPVVIVRLGEGAGVMERNAVTAHLADLPIDLRIQEVGVAVSNDTPTTGTASLELSLDRTEGGWRVTDGDASATPDVLREVEDEASPATTSEVLGVTLRAVVKDWLARPSPASEPPQQASKRQQHGIRLQAMYFGSTYAPQKPWQHGFQPSLGWYAAWGLGFRVGYTVFAPIEADSPLGSIRIHRHPIELMLGFDRTFDWLGWAIELGGVVDPQRRTAEGAQSEVGVAPAQWTTDGALALRARIGFRRSWWEMYLSGGAELWARPQHVVVMEARGQTAVMTPSRFRGQLGAGMAGRF